MTSLRSIPPTTRRKGFILSIAWFCAACASAPNVDPLPARASGPDMRDGVAPCLESIVEPETAFASIDATEVEDTQARIAERLEFVLMVLEAKGHRKLDPDQRAGVARALAAAEDEFGLSVVTSLAIIELESRFDPNARGPRGSIGLMQLQPATAREVAMRHGMDWDSDQTLLDPEQNAKLGLAYLAHLHERFGKTEHAIAAYNIGPSRLRRLLARRPFQRGPYLKQVYANVDALRQEYGDD